MVMRPDGPLGSGFRENQERKGPRKFKAGDRVRVNDSWEYVYDFLQEDNRVGTIVEVDLNGDYWLHMDKPVMGEDDECRKKRPSIIPDGHAYFAMLTEMELLEPAETQGSFDIDEWRKNLKPGDKVRISKKIGTQVSKWREWRNRVVTLKRKVEEHQKNDLWKIREEKRHRWSSHWFEPVEESKLREGGKEVFDSRLKNLIQTASNLIQIIETTFKDSKKYPIFGINLTKQEAEEKTRKSNLGESLLSVGVVLYHLHAGESEHNNHSYLLDGYPKPEDMPEEFWEMLDKLLKSECKGLSEFKKDLKQLKKALGEGVVQILDKGRPAEVPESEVEDNREVKTNQEIRKIWQTQIDRLDELGYHEALNMTEEDFANPDLIPLPDPEMENPIVVVPVDTLGAKKQMELIEVDGKHGCCGLDFPEDITEVLPRIYWIDLIQDGRGFLGRSPKECLEAFSDNERGLTIAEGIALIAQYPQTLKHHNIDLVGSRWHPGMVLTIWLGVDGKPILGLSSDETSAPEWGPPSCRINAPKNKPIRTVLKKNP